MNLDWFEVAMARTTSSEEGDCWLYNYDLTKNGYGRIKISGKRTRIHRLSYSCFNGEIPETLMVCHECDVRNCWNPAHLFVGTALDNYQDAMRKGRQPYIRIPSSVTGADFLARAAKEAQNILDLFILLRSKKAVADELGINAKRVGRIVSGQSWPGIDRSALNDAVLMPSQNLTDIVKSKLSSSLRKTYSVIESCGENGISIPDLSISLFGSENGETKRNIATTIITVCRLRKALSGEGIAIPAGYSDRRYRVQVAA